MKRLEIAIFSILILGFFPLTAQETAAKYFDKISTYYASINDYEGTLSITKDKSLQVAHISYKSPGLLHLEFSKPRGQVMNINQDKLQLYLPNYRVEFIQSLKNRDKNLSFGMINDTGLGLLKKNYSIAYLNGPGLSPLEDGSAEKVVKLRLYWRSSQEGFREIILSIGNDQLIRRMEAISPSSDKTIFDYTNMSINKGIPDERFQYKSPPEGNSIEDFLFESEN